MTEKTDLRITKTYRALHQAFTELLDQKRFEDITVGELCDRAMIRRTTFYKHFADKYEYFTFYINELRDQFAAQLPADIKNKRDATYIVVMSRELFRFMQEHERLVSHIAGSNLESVLFNLLYEMVRRDLIAEMDPDVYTPETRGLTSAFFSGGLLCTLRYWIDSRHQITEDQFISAVIALMETKFSEIKFV